jgi:exoribonuclease II
MMIGPGTVVEYIEQQKMVCAVVLEFNDQRVRLLNENGEEASQKIARLSHISKIRLRIGNGREKLVASLKETSASRQALSRTININELWEILSSTGEWVDLSTMTGLCFPVQPNSDHEAAVIRACFDGRAYFKFEQDSFFAHPEDQVAKNLAKEKEKQQREEFISAAAAWLVQALTDPSLRLTETSNRYADILKSYYLFGKDSPHHVMARSIMAQAQVENIEKIFEVMVNIGFWNPNQNLDLYRYKIPVEFPERVVKRAEDIKVKDPESRRKNLIYLPMMTIDGPGTMDFDDAISFEAEGGYFRIGIHISDVGAYIPRGDLIDQEMMERGTSIYMPDMRIPMLPPVLAENICSLKAGEIRPAISVFVKTNSHADIFEYEVVPSLIEVKQQWTYNYVDQIAESDPAIGSLCEIARNFRKKRIDSGAVLISLPEISIRVFEGDEISFRRIDRESPSRLLVAEMMIMANWLMAKFLAAHHMPAIFRSQPEPKARLYNQRGEGTLFQNWMQRRLLNRLVLTTKAENHSGLGLDAYVTATSPIRKCFDLVTQRQIRSCLNLDSPYSAEEIQQIISMLEQPLSHAMLVQNHRHRYWLLKYLEGKVGAKEEAVVLDRRRDGYTILMTTYLIESKLSLSGGWNLKPQDLVQVTIQHVDARRDVLTVSLG